MASVLTIGLGVAAAAFVVCFSNHPGHSAVLTFVREELVWWHLEGRGARRLVRWGGHSIREALSPR